MVYIFGIILNLTKCSSFREPKRKQSYLKTLVTAIFCGYLLGALKCMQNLKYIKLLGYCQNNIRCPKTKRYINIV